MTATLTFYGYSKNGDRIDVYPVLCRPGERTEPRYMEVVESFPNTKRGCDDACALVGRLNGGLK